MLRAQGNEISYADMCMKPYNSKFNGHPMRSVTGLEVVSLVQRIIKKRGDVNVLYESRRLDGVQPPVGFPRILSYMS